MACELRNSMTKFLGLVCSPQALLVSKLTELVNPTLVPHNPELIWFQPVEGHRGADRIYG